MDDENSITFSAISALYLYVMQNSCHSLLSPQMGSL